MYCTIYNKDAVSLVILTYSTCFITFALLFQEYGISKLFPLFLSLMTQEQIKDMRLSLGVLGRFL